jgi:hypothetical protein
LPLCLLSVFFSQRFGLSLIGARQIQGNSTTGRRERAGSMS